MMRPVQTKHPGSDLHSWEMLQVESASKARSLWGGSFSFWSRKLSQAPPQAPAEAASAARSDLPKGPLQDPPKGPSGEPPVDPSSRPPGDPLAGPILGASVVEDPPAERLEAGEGQKQQASEHKNYNSSLIALAKGVSMPALPVK